MEMININEILASPINPANKINKANLYYTCWGSVRGGCGVAHRSLEAVRRHLEADARDCRAAGGYSDRQAMRLDAPADARGARADSGNPYGPGEPVGYLGDY